MAKNTETEKVIEADVGDGEVEVVVVFDEVDEVDPVQELVDKGWALTTARRYLGVEDPNHGIDPDYPTAPK